MDAREKITLAQGALRENETLAPDEPLQGSVLAPGYILDEWHIVRLLDERKLSALYIARDKAGNECVIKLYTAVDRHDPDAIYENLKAASCGAIPFIGWGRAPDGRVYECMEYWRGVKTLSQQLPLGDVAYAEDFVLTKIMPQLAGALNRLHVNGLLHNDLKPENILWDAANNRLGVIDYGSMCMESNPPQQPSSYTPSYAAPEVIITGGQQVSRASDMCALGLTVYTAITGQALINADTPRAAKRLWQRGFDLSAGDKLSYNTVCMLRRLLSVDSENRMSYEQLAAFISLPTVMPGVSRASTNLEQEFSVEFKDGKRIANMDDFAMCALEDWNHLNFLFHQHRLDAFLEHACNKIDNVCTVCEQYINVLDHDAGLYQLMQTLSGRQEIIWLGRKYKNVLDMCSASEAELKTGETSLTEKLPVVRFFRAGLYTFYRKSLKESLKADDDDLALSRRLETKMKEDPESAMAMLHFGTVCSGLTSVDDLAETILRQGYRVDEYVSRLIGSPEFEFWLDIAGESEILKGTYELIEKYDVGGQQ